MTSPVDDTARPLSVERIREVLAAWPPPVAGDGTSTEPDLVLASDYHRIIEIHQAAEEGGVHGLREALAAQLRQEPPAEAVAETLPAGDALGTRRMASVRQDRHEATRHALARLDSIGPDEEAAVLACRGEIEAALQRLR